MNYHWWIFHQNRRFPRVANRMTIKIAIWKTQSLKKVISLTLCCRLFGWTKWGKNIPLPKKPRWFNAYRLSSSDLRLSPAKTFSQCQVSQRWSKTESFFFISAILPVSTEILSTRPCLLLLRSYDSVLHLLARTNALVNKTVGVSIVDLVRLK